MGTETRPDGWTNKKKLKKGRQWRQQRKENEALGCDGSSCPEDRANSVDAKPLLFTRLDSLRRHLTNQHDDHPLAKLSSQVNRTTGFYFATDPIRWNPEIKLRDDSKQLVRVLEPLYLGKGISMPSKLNLCCPRTAAEAKDRGLTRDAIHGPGKIGVAPSDCSAGKDSVNVANRELCLLDSLNVETISMPEIWDTPLILAESDMLTQAILAANLEEGAIIQSPQELTVPNVTMLPEEDAEQRAVMLSQLNTMDMARPSCPDSVLTPVRTEDEHYSTVASGEDLQLITANKEDVLTLSEDWCPSSPEDVQTNPKKRVRDKDLPDENKRLSEETKYTYSVVEIQPLNLTLQRVCIRLACHFGRTFVGLYDIDVIVMSTAEIGKRFPQLPNMASTIFSVYKKLLMSRVLSLEETGTQKEALFRLLAVVMGVNPSQMHNIGAYLHPLTSQHQHMRSYSFLAKTLPSGEELRQLMKPVSCLRLKQFAVIRTPSPEPFQFNVMASESTPRNSENRVKLAMKDAADVMSERGKQLGNAREGINQADQLRRATQEAGAAGQAVPKLVDRIQKKMVYPGQQTTFSTGEGQLPRIVPPKTLPSRRYQTYTKTTNFHPNGQIASVEEKMDFYESVDWDYHRGQPKE